jgi:MFS transporter, YNFM family, putative membrane transport protein
VSSSSSRASLLVLGAAAFLVSADARVIDPLLKIIAAEFSVPKESAALTVSAYALPYGFCQLFYGPLGDRVGKVKVMAGAMLLFSVGTMLCAVVPNLWTFILLRFLTGIVAAAMIPLSLSYIGDKVPYEGRQAALGRFMSALMLGQIVSASGGGAFGEFLSWRGVFLVIGGAGVVVSLVLSRESRRVPEALTDRRFSIEPFIALLRLPFARVLFPGVFLEAVFVFGGLAYLATSMLERFPFLGPGQVGLMLAGYGVGGLFYSSTVRKLVPRIGERGVLLLGGSLLCAGYLSMGAMPVWWMFVPAVILYGMGYYTMHGPLQTRATELNPKARGTAVALFAFTFFLGQGVGPVLMGQSIRLLGYATSFTIGGIALILLATWLRTRFAAPPSQV